MNNSLRFLEALGQDAGLAGNTPEALHGAMAAFGCTREEREAMADPEALAALLGARVSMMALQFPGDEPQRDDDEPRRDDDEPLDPDEDPSIDAGHRPN